MKKLKLVLILLFISFVVFYSCEDDSSPKNYFKYDGKTYTLSDGYIEDYGPNNGSFDWDVYIISSKLNYNGDWFTGTGHIIYLDLNTSSENGLVTGIYTFSSERSVFTFVDAGAGINFNMDTESGTIVDVIGGTVEITISGNEVLFEFNLITNTTKTIKGRFKGVLTEIY